MIKTNSIIVSIFSLRSCITSVAYTLVSHLVLVVSLRQVCLYPQLSASFIPRLTTVTPSARLPQLVSGRSKHRQESNTQVAKFRAGVTKPDTKLDVGDKHLKISYKFNSRDRTCPCLLFRSIDWHKHKLQTVQ